MDSTILAAIIGALSTIGATIGTLLLTRIFDHASLSRRNVRQISLDGHWEGTVHQEGRLQGSPLDLQLKGASLDLQLTCTFKSTHRAIQGEGSLRAISQNLNLTLPMIMRGTFVYERFLKLEYESRPEEIIQFGFILLELSPDGQTLEGRWMGFGVVSRSLVYGSMQLCKSKSISHIVPTSAP